ncbi:hypothetical protein ACP70R_037983 [Stipagrostis hirtigluma subsp. patula]
MALAAGLRIAALCVFVLTMGRLLADASLPYQGTAGAGQHGRRLLADRELPGKQGLPVPVGVVERHDRNSTTHSRSLLQCPPDCLPCCVCPCVSDTP